MSYEPPDQPIPVAPAVLNYAGPAVPQRPAFNARRTLAWKGEHLFRVYLTPEQLYFIRIGGGRNNRNVAAAQFGLLGALIAWWVEKQGKKKEQRRVLQNEERPLDELLAEHKRNHVLPLSSLSDPAVEPTGFFGGGAIKWTFNVAGEKKRVTCVFDQTEDVESALVCLPILMPGLRVGVQYNEKKKRYVKIK